MSFVSSDSSGPVEQDVECAQYWHTAHLEDSAQAQGYNEKTNDTQNEK
jgi:hypothetical protein